jgi:hypothetical protein
VASRIAARLLTGPAAFLVGGVIVVVAYIAVATRARLGRGHIRRQLS